MEPMTKKYQKVSEYIEYVQSQGKYWITKTEAMKHLGITPSSFYNAVHKLAKHSKLIRVRNGFYIIVPPEYRNLQGLPPSHYIDALMKYLKQPYYIGILSAAALHGSSHQSPQELQVVTSKAIPLLEVGHSRIRFIKKKDIEKTTIQQMKTPTGYINVSTPAATIFDLLRYVRLAGHLDNVATIIAEMTEDVNTAELIKTAKKEKDLSQVQRLGFLIDRYSNNKAAARDLSKIIKEKFPNFVFLRPDKRKGILEKDNKWNIFVNTEVEPDL